jgi:hypothetical protein
MSKAYRITIMLAIVVANVIAHTWIIIKYFFRK